MNKTSCRCQLPVAEDVDRIANKHHSASPHGVHIDAHRPGKGKCLVPGAYKRSVRFDLRGFLYERQRLVPLSCVPVVHCFDELLRSLYGLSRQEMNGDEQEK